MTDQPGATGQYPNGKLNEHDEGELQIKIGTENGAVVMHFGKEIMWLGLSPTDARGLAALMLKNADLLEK